MHRFQYICRQSKAVASVLAPLFLFIGVLMTAPEAQAAPIRVLSLDSCADQYVLALAAEEQIAGLSPRATWDDSFYQHRAQDFPSVRPTLEAVLAQNPDLVVAMWADGALVERLQNLGIQVLRLPMPRTFEEIRQVTQQFAARLGQANTARQLINHMDSLLRQGQTQSGTVAYLTPGGVTSGPGTLPAEIIAASGYQLMETRAGYHALSLETWMQNPPSQVVASYFKGHQGQWSWGQHAVVRRRLQEIPMQHLNPKWVGCPAWFAAYAVARLRGGL